DARAALRRRARRPPGRWPEGQHHRRRERVPVRRVLAGGARPGDTPGDRRIRRPDCVAKARARGHGSAVRLAPLRGAVFRAVRPRPRGAVGLPFQLTGNAMEFVLALHSHLPYVLNHGRWPHGSDWLCEAALDTYLPLLERLEELAAEGTPTPLTIGFTPVLANQLASPAFAGELEAFFAQRLAACDEAPPALQASGDGSLVPLVDYWRSRLTRLRELFRRIDRDLVSAFRRLQEQGRLEIIGSAATHGYLPLLGRDESIRRRPGGMLAAGVRLSPARQVAWEKGAARHRAAPRGRGVSLLLHRRASRARGQPARRLRRDSARRGAIRRGAARSGVHDGSSSAGRALALSGVPGLRSRCTPRGRGAGARPPLFHADLEPTPGLPRRRVVPRVSQDPLEERGSR